jgi:hypothetical protein
VFAAALMAGSSLLVVARSLRAQRRMQALEVVPQGSGAAGGGRTMEAAR